MNLSHNLSGITVGQRASDGYINATALTTAHKQATGKRKDVADWLRNKRTQETLEHLSSAVRIPVFELYQVFEGASENGGGTWLHPKLSVRFAVWLSDDFGFQVENWVEQWMVEGKNPITQQPISTAELSVIMPTEQELAYIRSRAWEKTEMRGYQVPVNKIKERTGYRRAIDIVRDMAKRAQNNLPSSE